MRSASCDNKPLTGAPVDFAVCAMNCRPTTEAMQDLSTLDLSELILVTLYRLNTYAVVNLIDDAAMLAIVFI